MTTPTSDRTSDNESGEQSGGEAKFTPGPWQIEIRDDPSCIVIYSGQVNIASAWDIYSRDGMVRSPTPIQANARLIASAPAMHTELHRLRAERAELLAALTLASAYMETTHAGDQRKMSALFAARTAIANAKSAEAGA